MIWKPNEFCLWASPRMDCNRIIVPRLKLNHQRKYLMARIQKIYLSFCIFYYVLPWYRSNGRKSDVAHSTVKGKGQLCCSQNDGLTPLVPSMQPSLLYRIGEMREKNSNHVLESICGKLKNNQMGQLFVVGLTRCACLYCLWPKLLNSGNSAPNFDRRKLNWLILCCPLLKKKDGLEGGVGSFLFTYKF